MQASEALEGKVPCGAKAPTERALGDLQSCRSTTAVSRIPTLLQLRRVPLEFCPDLLLRRCRTRHRHSLHRSGTARDCQRAPYSLGNACCQLCIHVSHLCKEQRCQLFTKACLGNMCGEQPTQPAAWHLVRRGRTGRARPRLPHGSSALHCDRLLRPPRRCLCQHHPPWSRKSFKRR